MQLATQPELDQALARLLTDLDERGMLDETLVMVTSEFGRTPKINKDNGRDHHPRVFSALLVVVESNEVMFTENLIRFQLPLKKIQ